MQSMSMHTSPTRSTHGIEMNSRQGGNNDGIAEQRRSNSPGRGLGNTPKDNVNGHMNESFLPLYFPVNQKYIGQVCVCICVCVCVCLYIYIYIYIYIYMYAEGQCEWTYE